MSDLFLLLETYKNPLEIIISKGFFLYIDLENFNLLIRFKITLPHFYDVLLLQIDPQSLILILLTHCYFVIALY